MIDLIIDTDIGGDIDDALALSMALHDERINLLGVTTAYIGNAWRCDIVRRMLAAYGREDVPVLFGAEAPLLGAWGDVSPGENEAVPFLIERARQGKITLLAIGPATNIALALRQAPDIARNLAICMMGGMVTRAHPEWNVLCDPEAADIVLTSGAAITLVGLDVTEKCRLDQAQALALVAGDNAEMTFLRGEMERFLRSFDFLPTLHDPLALLCLLRPDICRYEMKDIRVETRGEWTRGVTVDRRYPEQAPIRVAVDVRAKDAVDEICRLVRNKQMEVDPMLETLRTLNSFPIYDVGDPEFAPYGRVTTDVDVSSLIAACAPNMPVAGVCYEPSLESLENCDGFAAMQRYFGSPMQAGCCWGHNAQMDALEYHRASEFNIAVTDLVLFLADRREMDEEYRLDSGKVKAFFVPKGTCVEVYATTLHYAPCEVTKDGFYCIVILPRGTNHALVNPPATSGEERLMTARDKWLICCKDVKSLVDSGAYPGVLGENPRLVIAR